MEKYDCCYNVEPDQPFVFGKLKSHPIVQSTRMPIEELYQIFKKRLIEEISVNTPNTSHYGILVDKENIK